jgi:hypothetical protein
VLETLLVRNFQAHKHLAIDLDPGVTTIIGPSDRGKSAVVRSLIWLMTNRPGGDAFIRDGEPEAAVSLTIDGRTITRRRGAAVNQYSLDNKQFEAFGTEVPPEIAQLLQTNPINYQGQHDAPFWFADTAGQVSRSLNSIVDLRVMDEVLGYLAGQVRTATAEVEAERGRLAQATAEQERLSWVPAMMEDLEEINTLDIALAAKRATAAAVRSLVVQALAHRDTAERAGRAATAGQTAVAAAGRLHRAADGFAKLRGLVDSIRTASRQSALRVPDMAALEAKRGAIIEKQRMLNLLLGLVNAGRGMEATLANAAREHDEAAKNLERKTEGRCPLCGTTF